VENIFGRHFCDHEEIKVVRDFQPDQHNRELHPIHDETRKTNVVCFFGIFIKRSSNCHSLSAVYHKPTFQTDSTTLD